MLSYSQHKFASNVIECCLQYGTPTQKIELVREILTKDESGTTPLEIMVKDPYANYVVQKVIDIVSDEQRAEVVRQIRAHAAHLKRFTYGKHIMSKIASKMQQSAQRFVAE